MHQSLPIVLICDIPYGQPSSCCSMEAQSLAASSDLKGPRTSEYNAKSSRPHQARLAWLERSAVSIIARITTYSRHKDMKVCES